MIEEPANNVHIPDSIRLSFSFYSLIMEGTSHVARDQSPSGGGGSLNGRNPGDKNCEIITTSEPE